MTGFNMPPGCSVNDILGNRLEDSAYEAAWTWAEEQLRDLTESEFRRAVLIGKAAVIAESHEIHSLWSAGISEGRLREREDQGDL